VAGDPPVKAICGSIEGCWDMKKRKRKFERYNTVYE
jgi:hypothetical protein